MKMNKDKIFTKKVLYVVCFMALNFLDVMRNFQFLHFKMGERIVRLTDFFPGYKIADIWLIVGNMAGIFMAIILFSACPLKRFCNRFNAIWSGVCMAAGIGVCFIDLPKYGMILPQVELAVFNLWWIGILVKYYIYEIFVKHSIKIAFNKTAVLWTVMTVFMLLSQTRFKVWPLWYYFMFGLFYITPYTIKDRELLFDSMIDGSLIAFYIMQIISFFLRPFNDARYQGMHTDWNISALYYLIIFLMCLFKLHILNEKNGKKGQKLFYEGTTAVTLCLQIMTGCRTAWVTSAVVILLYGIFVLIKREKISFLKSILRGMRLVVLTVLLFVPVFFCARYLKPLSPAEILSVEEYGVIRDYTELDEFLENTFQRVYRIFGGIKEKDTDESATAVMEGTDANATPQWIKDPASRERYQIYVTYLSHTTWVGGLTFDDSDGTMYHAHNLWIQMAYTYGIPVGILCVVMAVVLIVNNYRKMKYNEKNPYGIIGFFVTLVFFIYGLMECVWMIGQLTLFLVYFAQCPLSESGKEKEGKAVNCE